MRHFFAHWPLPLANASQNLTRKTLRTRHGHSPRPARWRLSSPRLSHLPPSRSWVASAHRASRISCGPLPRLAISAGASSRPARPQYEAAWPSSTRRTSPTLRGRLRERATRMLSSLARWAARRNIASPISIRRTSSILRGPLPSLACRTQPFSRRWRDRLRASSASARSACSKWPTSRGLLPRPRPSTQASLTRSRGRQRSGHPISARKISPMSRGPSPMRACSRAASSRR